MHRPLLPILLVIALTAGCSSSGKPTAPTGAPPTPSAVGVAAGDPFTKSIGTAGGSLSSPDGGITITIPSGALTTDTTIGIQPITNTAGAGIGAAYRLSPSGQTFAKPVTLSFPYTDTDLNGTYAAALGIAYQDDTGRWEWQDGVALDTAAKTLTVASTHFSDWSKVPGIQLLPPSATVKPNGKVSLSVVTCLAPSGNKKYIRFKCGDLPYDLASLTHVIPGTWAVDGAPGGTTGHGLVSGGAESAVYTAPAKKPAGSGRGIVAVSVQVKQGKSMIQIASNITILSGYHLVGKFKEVNTPLVCPATIAAWITDTVSFDAQLTGDNTYTVTNIMNFKTDAAPAIEVVGGKPAGITNPPDVFKAESGEASLLTDTDLVTASLKGTITIGSCNLGLIVPGTGETTDDIIGVSFYTSNFNSSGVQTDVPPDIGRKGWTWTITQQ